MNLPPSPDGESAWRAASLEAVQAGAEIDAHDVLGQLKAHPVYSIANMLANYVGVEKDLIQLVEFLSLAAGRMVMPINVDVQTDQVAVDLHLANRILDLRQGHVARVDTHRQFRALEQDQFRLRASEVDTQSADDDDKRPRPVAAVLIRGNHRLLHREVSEYTARLVGANSSLPSILRVSDLFTSLPPLPSTLRLQATQVGRELGDFGYAFAGRRHLPVESELAQLIESLPLQPVFPCPFRPSYRGKIRPDLMLVVERLLTVFVALRVTLPGGPNMQPAVLLEDYHALRAMLTNLPLVPLDREITPQAMLTGEAVFEAVHKCGKKLELPDHSQHGGKWFTRMDAMEWTDHGYNTVKKHLRELEGEGIVTSTLAENNRERGRQIHFRFLDGREPPFAWRNPFERLPDLGAAIGS